jgi:hypothetical protein
MMCAKQITSFPAGKIKTRTRIILRVFAHNEIPRKGQFRAAA